ncbi:hypothetical protein PLICRDRAFT_47320 [Plicaturopsis crispa FD-325 SS-3]|uniref:Uncharacterized protein n=1 Tax=Plicaturopsis crispa FD-325 SS-3 TaxID=944288 RepID=A0A0C9T5B3_PLICR|nr:hypothetical protein PLICRDRAFT_47320 [Plicaturopsis crispa FD-325 SS-3]
MSDTLEQFASLDELTQVIYQGPYKFVVLSKVNDEAWTIHLGLSGAEGRWWRGERVEDDILRVVGHKASSTILEAFADKLEQAFVQGELYVNNWSSEKGADIKLTFDPSGKNPLHIPLTELSPEAAASHATSIFFDIAREAQSRKCRYNPASFAPVSAVAPARGAPARISTVKSAKDPGTSKTSPPTAATKPVTTAAASSNQSKDSEEVQKLKAELAKAQLQNKKPLSSSSNASSSKPGTSAKRPPKGASLANPNKKARKYQAIEFESDDDDG